jgi:2-keto-4-pentenoate hydratase
MDETQAREAAALIANNRLRRTRFAALPAPLVPRDEAAGYRIQALVHAALHSSYGALSGHKIGCTTKVMQDFLKIDQPCAGRVFAAHVHHGAAHVRHDDYVRPGVECEIAIMLGTDLPATGMVYNRSSVAMAVGGVMAAIEIVDDRYADFRSLGAPTLIADDFFNAGSVLSAPVHNWRGLDLAAIAGGMTINGRDVGRGRGAQIMGHPLEALAWLANLRAREGLPLRAGEFVSLGSMVETKWIDADDEVVVEIDGLGRVTARFAATSPRP